MINAILIVLFLAFMFLAGRLLGEYLFNNWKK